MLLSKVVASRVLLVLLPDRVILYHPCSPPLFLVHHLRVIIPSPHLQLRNEIRPHLVVLLPIGDRDHDSPAGAGLVV